MDSIQKFNFPDKDDPLFSDKLVDMVRTLFENADNPIKLLSPLASTPEDIKVGNIWFDEASGKVKVSTSEGIKILKYE